MASFAGKISVCGKRELDKHAGRGITHLLAIEDPDVTVYIPPWFKGAYERIQFHDVEQMHTAMEYNAVLPNRKHVQAILRFGRECFAGKAGSHLLLHCAAGISRSPAAAFAILTQQLGPGRALEAFKHVLSVRPDCSPNRLVIEHADGLLGLNGEMIQVLAAFRNGSLDSHPPQGQ